MSISVVYTKPGRKPQTRRAGTEPVFCFTVSNGVTAQTFSFRSPEEAERERALALEVHQP